MGISGLLPLLRSVENPTHIRQWAGKTVGVDAYGWLHKGIISCAVELATNKPTTKYVDYVMGRVKMLTHFGVVPYLVFDGDYLPSKASTEADREKRRAQSKILGLEHLRNGRNTAAHQELQKSIDVSPSMARAIIDACSAMGVECLVAPYEADSQLYYLESIGVVDAVVSEDSDLLVFGVKSLITKLNQFGECVEFNREKLTGCKEVSFVGWTQDQFRWMCILSGCDYLDSVPGMGLKTAHRMLKRYKDVEKVLRALRFEGKKKIPEGYLEMFWRADMTFRYQRVFDPRKQCLVMANQPGPEVVLSDETLVYIGPDIEAEIAAKVAKGLLDPMTKLPIVAPTMPARKDLSKGVAYTSSTFGATVSAVSMSQPATPARRGPTLTDFFKSRTPLQSKTTNQAAQFSSSASARVPVRADVFSPPKKRTLPLTVKEEEQEKGQKDGVKKMRLSPQNAKVEAVTPRPIPARQTSTPQFTPQFTPKIKPEPSSAPQTAEKSTFFKSQTRRSISTTAAPLATPTTARRSISSVTGTPYIASPPKRRAYTDRPTPSPSSSAPTPSRSMTSTTTVIKEESRRFSVTSTSTTSEITKTESVTETVTQGWKQRFGFSQEKNETKIAEIIEKQRPALPRRLTPLQQMGAKSMGVQKRQNAFKPPMLKSRTSTSTSQETEGASQDSMTESQETNITVPSRNSSFSGISHSFDDSAKAEKGMFEKFAFGK
ncbi:PIN domain-like protein [Pyronema omphalodes]|nr:PIN domain-like protein [Pyronema omphalodes]